MPTQSKNIRELSTGNRKVWNLDPRIIGVKPGFNGRDEGPDLDEHIATIARSIVHRGFDLSKPITIFRDGALYFVSDGHCRLRATMLAIEMGADIRSIPVITEAVGVNEADRVLGLITRNSGKNLSAVETGRVYKRLLGFGWNEKQIADSTGKSIAHVRSIFTLMEADPANHKQIAAGEISATVVTAVVREHGPAKAEKVLTRAIKQAKANGQAKATARDVRAVTANEPTTKARPMSEIVEFFRITLVEQDGPPGVQKLASAFLEFRDGKATPERFMKRLTELTGVREAVEAK